MSSALSNLARALTGLTLTTSVLVLDACERDEDLLTSSPPPDVPESPPLPRFWLQRVALADSPGGAPGRFVEGPVLVELRADGYVNSIADTGATPGASTLAIDEAGYLPPVALKEPDDRRGLMLYARAVTDLHLDSPEGPTIGRLHPGAFVSVAAHDDAYWMIAVPRYGRRRFHNEHAGELRAYVERSALTPDVVVEEPMSPRGVFTPAFRAPLSVDGEWFTEVTCGHFWRRGDFVTQYYRGVEVAGTLVQWAPDEYWQSPEWRRREERRAQIPCSPNYLMRDTDGAFLAGVGRDAGDAVISREPPDGFDLLRDYDPSDNPLYRLFGREASVYWLTDTRRGLECQRWDLLPGRGRTADLKSTVMVHVNGRQRYKLRADYVPDANMAKRHFGGFGRPHVELTVEASVSRLDFDPTGTSVSFVLYGDDAGVMHMKRAGRVLPYYGASPRLAAFEDARVVGFRSEQLEHWFLDEGQCERARTNAIRILEADPEQYPNLGLHIEHSYDLWR